MESALVKTLENDGPQTMGELVARFEAPRAVIRQALAALVFDQRRVTWDREKHFMLGDPTSWLSE